MPLGPIVGCPRGPVGAHGDLCGAPWVHHGRTMGHGLHGLHGALEDLLQDRDEEDADLFRDALQDADDLAAADAVADAVPWHNPNDGGPRTSGVHGVRPSYGLFLRLLRDSTFDGVTLSFAQNDDRPAVVLIDCRNVSFGGELRMARGSGSGYDVGMRDSTAIAISAAGGIRACAYPHCPEPTAAPAEPPRVG